MVPASFPESNLVLDKPKNMTYNQCDALSVHMGVTADNIPVTISCWKLTASEFEMLKSTGRIWITIIGHGMPPILPTVDSPFLRPQ